MHKVAKKNKKNITINIQKSRIYINFQSVRLILNLHHCLTQFHLHPNTQNQINHHLNLNLKHLKKVENLLHLQILK